MSYGGLMHDVAMSAHAPRLAPDDCLFLDVDGTLIELADTPFDVHVTQDLGSVLRAVSARLGGALALVSGRSIAYLDTLFAPLKLPCAGLHGVERRGADGRLHGTDIPISRLDAVRAPLAQLVQENPGTLLEDKGRTIAVHYRLAPAAAAVIHAGVESIAAGLSDAYQIQAGNHMLEIKPRAFDKGAAVTAFMAESPFRGRTPIFVGDDLTDLDGFTAVRALGGRSIAVGRRISGQYQLDDPARVRGWLRDFSTGAAAAAGQPSRI